MAAFAASSGTRDSVANPGSDADTSPLASAKANMVIHTIRDSVGRSHTDDVIRSRWSLTNANLRPPSLGEPLTVKGDEQAGEMTAFRGLP